MDNGYLPTCISSWKLNINSIKSGLSKLMHKKLSGSFICMWVQSSYNMGQHKITYFGRVTIHTHKNLYDNKEWWILLYAYNYYFTLLCDFMSEGCTQGKNRFPYAKGLPRIIQNVFWSQQNAVHQLMLPAMEDSTLLMTDRPHCLFVTVATLS